MPIKILKVIFKVVILLNLMISLYMGVYLAADRFLNRALKSSSNQSIEHFQNETDIENSEVSTIDSRKLSEDQNSYKKTIRKQLKYIINCYDRDIKRRAVEHGDFWVLKNFVRANHRLLKCYEAVTFTTHADFTFLENLIVLVERWESPISIALYAPGTDFDIVVQSIAYLRDCLPQSYLIQRYVTFHLYFPSQHIPRAITKTEKIDAIQCAQKAPYKNIKPDEQYRIKKNLLYPGNVGRNIARAAALTHYVLVCDIDLYPSVGLAEQFLEMIAHNLSEINFAHPRVFALPVFNIESSVPVPNNKTNLQYLYEKKLANPFHGKFEGADLMSDWIFLDERPILRIFRNVYRVGILSQWQPIFIGSHHDPYYEERLSLETHAEQMPSSYVLCLLNYSFSILDNAFLVRKSRMRFRSELQHNNRTSMYIKNNLLPKLTRIYGKRKGCVMFGQAENHNKDKRSIGKNLIWNIKLFLLWMIIYGL